ncbi:MAG: uncharacterized protein QG657_3069 [Acidobacteriota bacterium]|nr:uncharacterized protein [Acidobacteriota bacterium]
MYHPRGGSLSTEQSLTMARIEDKELSKVVDVIVDKVLPQKIFLFGSRAMNKADEKSDYDIFVLVKGCKHPRRMEKDLYYLLAREGVGIPVDLLVDTEERFERLKGNRYLIYHEVEKYGKTLYDKETASPGMA